jgi:hypothetical protein
MDTRTCVLLLVSKLKKSRKLLKLQNIVDEQVQQQLLNFYQTLHEYMMSDVRWTAATHDQFFNGSDLVGAYHKIHDLHLMLTTTSCSNVQVKFLRVISFECI